MKFRDLCMKSHEFYCIYTCLDGSLKYLVLNWESYINFLNKSVLATQQTFFSPFYTTILLKNLRIILRLFVSYNIIP